MKLVKLVGLYTKTPVFVNPEKVNVVRCGEREFPDGRKALVTIVNTDRGAYEVEGSVEAVAKILLEGKNGV